MACVLKRRNQQLSQLIIENPQLSVKNSIDFLKKMTIVAVSYITLRRNVFPESAYEKRKWDGTQLNILKGRDTIFGARKLVDTIKNALKTIETRHLLKLYLLVLNKNTNATIEVYTISFTYNEEEINCHIEMPSEDQEMKGQNNDKEVPTDIKFQIRQLLSNLDSFASELPPLPDDYVLRLRLQVKDDEEFVMPQLFTPMESLDFNFPSDVRNFKLGKTFTKFTKLTVSSKSNLHAKEDGENYDDKEPEDLDTEPTTVCCNNSMEIVNAASQKENSETTNLTSTMSSVHLRNKEVKCICERDDDILENIMCAVCFTYQHKACYKLLEHQTVGRHVCVNCHVPDDEKRKCMHPELMNEEEKVDAFYRRALSLCENNKKVSVNTFVSHLNLPRKEALKIFQRLIEDGCFVHETKERNIRTVDLEHLKKNVLNVYFNTTTDNDMEFVESQDYIPPSGDESKNKHLKRGHDSEGEYIRKRVKYGGSNISITSSP